MTRGSATDELVQRIRDDRELGASELARQCLAGLARRARVTDADDAEALRTKLVELAKQLQSARPTMAPIANLVGQWIAAVEGSCVDDIDKLRAEASVWAEKLVRVSADAVSKAASHAAELIGTDRTIITHSLSSTVIAVFEQLMPRVKAIVTESRPPGEGRKLAEALSKLGVATDFISDQQTGLFVKQADAALIGADTIAAAGAVINKAGTYLLALAAREQGIPFYVCFESFKYSDIAVTDVVLEQHDPAELDPPQLPHVKAHNIYFDVTPSNLVTAWITEDGVSRESTFQIRT